MDRVIKSGTVSYDQLVVYDPVGSFNRVAGIVVSDLTLKVFANNELLGWSLADGSLTTDDNIVPGYLYFNEIPGAPGFYALRFLPDRVGYWNISIIFDANSSETVYQYLSEPSQYYPSPSAGLTASFI